MIHVATLGLENWRNNMENNEVSKLIKIEQLLNCLLSIIKDQQNNHGLVTQKELLAILHVSPNTLKSWENTGLKRLEPPIEGTRTVYYKMDDVIKYLTP